LIENRIEIVRKFYWKLFNS